MPANSAFGLALWKVRGQGRSYAPRLREDLVGAGLPANSAFRFTLWKVHGQGRSRTSDLQGWRKCKRIVGNNPCLCFATPAHPCAMAALAHLTSRDGRSRTSMCFAAPAHPCAMEEMQKDCREQSLPVLRDTCTSLCNGRSYRDSGVDRFSWGRACSRTRRRGSRSG